MTNGEQRCVDVNYGQWKMRIAWVMKHGAWLCWSRGCFRLHRFSFRRLFWLPTTPLYVRTLSDWSQTSPSKNKNIGLYSYIYVFLVVCQDPTVVYCTVQCVCYNSYRRRKWTEQAEFKLWTKLFAFQFALMPLGKKHGPMFSHHLWINSRGD